MRSTICSCILCCAILVGNSLHAQRYQAIVSPGASIQAAIEAAPEKPDKPYVILVKNGIYNEKVIINKPNIVLVGENRDSTRIIYAELASKRTVKEYKGKPVGNGEKLKGHPIYLNANGTYGPVAVHATYLDGRIAKTEISRSIKSYIEYIKNPMQYDMFTNVVPGVLKYYDVQDIIKKAGKDRIQFAD